MRPQDGVALFSVLIILLVLSITGFAMMMASTTQHKISRVQQDRELALLAAEAALRDAEMDLQCLVFKSGAQTPEFCAAGSGQKCRSFCQPGSKLSERKFSGFEDAQGTTRCASGACQNLSPAIASAKFDATNSAEFGSRTGNKLPAGALGGGTVPPPRYVIEGFLDASNYPSYRITAQAVGRSEATRVTLQEVFRPWN